jgi:hypothetical protein
MHKVVVLSCLVGACYGFAPSTVGSLTKASRGSSVKMEDLEELAVQLNPIVGYWDPLGLGKQQFWGQDNAATVGFLRHAEIKHGRVAMAAFVGFCVQSNNIYFPWKLTGDIQFGDIAAAGGPPAQWDALPTSAKVQILLFIGFLELWSETSSVLAKDGGAHYMRGGVPGKFPNFNGNDVGSADWVNDPKWINQGSVPHPVFNLYDPFELNSGKSREELDKSLLAEINNGRLAQIGIFGALSTTKGLIVPGLDSIPGIRDQAYDGEIMAPFTAGDKLPFLPELLKTQDEFLKFPFR